MRVKYWITDACKMVLGLLLGSAIFSLVMTAQGASSTVGDYLTEFTGFYLFFGALIQIILLQTSFKLQLPLVISMGCTRKEAHLGYHLYRLTFIVLALCIYSVLTHLPGNAMQLSVFLALGIYLVLGAVGSGLGMIAVRLGNKAMIVFVVIFALLCGVLGGLIGVGAATVMGSFLSHGPVPLLVLALGILCHLLVMIPETKTIQNLVVKL